jgi:hypothetical protein
LSRFSEQSAAHLPAIIDHRITCKKSQVFHVRQNSAAIAGQIIPNAETLPPFEQGTIAMKTQRRWLKSVIAASEAQVPAMPWTRGQRRKPKSLTVSAPKPAIAAR